MGPISILANYFYFLALLSLSFIVAELNDAICLVIVLMMKKKIILEAVIEPTIDALTVRRHALNCLQHPNLINNTHTLHTAG